MIDEIGGIDWAILSSGIRRNEFDFKVAILTHDEENILRILIKWLEFFRDSATGVVFIHEFHLVLDNGDFHNDFGIRFLCKLWQVFSILNVAASFRILFAILCSRVKHFLWGSLFKQHFFAESKVSNSNHERR